MTFKFVRALFAASMLLLAVGCEGSSIFTLEPTPTPSPTHMPAPTLTITPSPAPRQLILGSVLSPDGLWMAVVDDLGVRVYETISYSEVWRAPVTGMLDELRYNQVQIAWADDSTALTVSISQMIYDTESRFVSHLSRFDAVSGNLLWQQSFEDLPHVAFAPDGNHFLLMPIHLDSVELWDGLVPERTGILELPQYAMLAWPRAGNWSPDGSFIAGKLSIGSPTQVAEGGIGFTSAGLTEERSIFIWDAVTGKLVARLHDSRQGPISLNLGWSLDGSYLISDENGRFILWDAETWAYQSQIVYDAAFNWASIDLSPDGTKLVSLLYYNNLQNDIRFAVYAWEIPSGKRLPAAGGALLSARYGTSFDFVGWLPDGDSFLYEVDGRIVILDVNQGQVGEPFPIPEWWIAWGSLQNYDIDYYQLSTDGKRIYFVETQAVVVYDAQSGKVIAELAD